MDRACALLRDVAARRGSVLAVHDLAAARARQVFTAEIPVATSPCLRGRSPRTVLAPADSVSEAWMTTAILVARRRSSPVSVHRSKPISAVLIPNIRKGYAPE